MEPGRIQAIKERYGASHLRQCMLYERAGIPERYWERNWSGQTVKVHGPQFVTVLGSPDDVNVFVCSQLRRYIKMGRKCLYLDFLSVLSDHVEYGVASAGWIASLAKYDIVAVGNVSYGETYDRHSNVFPMLLNSIFNTGVIKTVFVGMENVAEADFEHAYGGHYVRHIIRSHESILLRITGSGGGTVRQLKLK